MDKNFTSKDAKQLIRTYNALLSSQNKVYSSYNENIRTIETLFDKLINQKVFDRAAIEELVNKINVRQNPNPAIDRLIHCIYYYRNQAPIIAELNQLNAAYKSVIDSKVQEAR